MRERALNSRLRDLREDADLTQAQVGERLGLSQRTYAYYESGQRMVPPEVLCALGDLYGVSVDYLLGRTDRREMNRIKKTAVWKTSTLPFFCIQSPGLRL